MLHFVEVILALLATMYGDKTWGVKRAQEKKLDLEETRMLRWMSGDTKLDRISREIYPGKCRKLWACIEIRSRICGQESGGDGGAGEKKERKTEGEVAG